MDIDRILSTRFFEDIGIPPLEIVGGEGVFMHLPDGVRVLDASSGPMVVSIGHGRAEVALAAYEAMRRYGYVLPAFACEPRVALIERLQRMLPGDLSRIFLTSGGTEALEAAVKLARKLQLARGQPSRWKVIGRELSYHGTSLATLACGHAPVWRDDYAPYMPDWPKIPLPRCQTTVHGPGRGPCDLSCADALEEAILAAGPETVSAFIAEPIGAAMSAVLVPPPGYYQRIREICDRYGVLFIADEVVTAFGRTGRVLALDHWGVLPDVVAFAKGMASGYVPIGAIAVREPLMREMEAAGLPPDTRYTMSGHPVGAAAADAVLGIVEREGLVERAAALEPVMAGLLAPLRRHAVVHDVRGRGLLWAVQLGRPEGGNFPREQNLTMQVVTNMLLRGVFLWPTYAKDQRGEGDAVILAPPLISEPEHLARAAEALDETLTELAQG